MRLKLYIAIILGFVAVSCSKTDTAVHGVDSMWMNTAVNPGDDFYEYACGGWLGSHTIPGEYSSYGINEVLDERNRQVIKDIIEDLASRSYSSPCIEQTIGNYYKLFLDTARQNADGISVIVPYLNMIQEQADRQQLISLMNYFGVRGSNSIVEISIGADLHDSHKNVLSLHADGLTLSTRDYYVSEDSAMVVRREAFKRHIYNMFRFAGNDSVEATSKMQNVIDLETRMARKTRTLIEFRDTEANYNMLSYAEFKKQFAGIDWDKLFEELFITGLDSLNVGQPETIHEAVALLNDAPLQQLKDWMQWTLIDQFDKFLGKESFNLTFDFYDRFLSGKDKPAELWKRAVDITDRRFGMPIGKLFVERCFPEANKHRMQQLVANLHKALAMRIKSQEWMSEQTKAKALDKLSTFTVKIGYPDKWPSYEGLVVDVEKNIVDNTMEMNLWKHKDFISRTYKKPVDRSLWYMTPQTVNAYYDPSTNEICFPAGILQPPFFDMEADDAFNYGDIGATIGHEMIHGFDDEGRQFDKDGNFVDWWTADDAAEFDKRATVMADFFDKIEPVPGLHFKGRQVLGENIADHGGLKVAWLAYKEATKENPLPVVDGLTADQRFFISYAFTWVQNEREEYIRNLVENDVHAVPRYRVNACLPHIDAWYEAFGVKEGDKLFVPKQERVNIW